jgi:hypothetical protein
MTYPADYNSDKWQTRPLIREGAYIDKSVAVKQ